MANDWTPLRSLYYSPSNWIEVELHPKFRFHHSSATLEPTDLGTFHFENDSEDKRAKDYCWLAALIQRKSTNMRKVSLNMGYDDTPGFFDALFLDQSRSLEPFAASQPASSTELDLQFPKLEDLCFANARMSTPRLLQLVSTCHASLRSLRLHSISLAIGQTWHHTILELAKSSQHLRSVEFFALAEETVDVGLRKLYFAMDEAPLSITEGESF
ncbi:MAG: hypothetical protein MMC23_003763 [Stictis urceolatum]|nr:hypothetical protein [Stictis urceolata]